MLADPNFLFRIERDPADVAAEHASTASATSSWRHGCRSSSGAAFPTRSCSTLAEQQQLREPAVLEEQVRRMLADPAPAALIDNFAGQWLLLRNLRNADPTPDVFPEFDESLREAFSARPTLFLAASCAKTAACVELLSADYTFVNERLARHYGIPNVYGAHFRRVTSEQRQPARRPARPGQHPDGDVVSQSDLARAARANGCSTTCSARRRRSRRRTCRA